MNPLLALRRYIRDLLTHSEQLIKLGRENFERSDLEAQYIVVDALAPSRRLSSLEDYDGSAEEQSLGAIFLTPCTLSFYGTGAWDLAMSFALNTRSQASKELQDTLGITVFQVSDVTDVGKILTGEQYGEEIELTLNVQHCQSTTVALTRIDTATLTDPIEAV